MSDEQNRKGRPDPLKKGLEQIDAYLASLQLPTGILVIFDRRPDAPPMEDRVTIQSAVIPCGRSITLPCLTPQPASYQPDLLNLRSP